jgi:hypothetical protein
MNRVLFAAALALAGCTTTPEIVPTQDFAPLGAQNPGYCTDYIIDTCEPPFVDAMAMCQRLYGEKWNELVSPVECWEDTPDPSWVCEPTNVQIVCPGAEWSPSDLWCCNQ